MSIHRTRLVSLGVKISNMGGGCCGGKRRSTTAYSLPMHLDSDILPFLTEFGTPAPPFEKTGLLKIDKCHFAITGVKRISQIRFIIKEDDGIKEIEKFENKLIQYIEWYNNK